MAHIGVHGQIQRRVHPQLVLPLSEASCVHVESIQGTAPRVPVGPASIKSRVNGCSDATQKTAGPSPNQVSTRVGAKRSCKSQLSVWPLTQAGAIAVPEDEAVLKPVPAEKTRMPKGHVVNKRPSGAAPIHLGDAQCCVEVRAVCSVVRNLPLVPLPTEVGARHSGGWPHGADPHELLQELQCWRLRASVHVGRGKTLHRRLEVVFRQFQQTHRIDHECLSADIPLAGHVGLGGSREEFNESQRYRPDRH